MVALAGVIAAVRDVVFPVKRLIWVLFRLTPVTATGVTVTCAVAVLLPSAVLTVTVAVPAATPVTNPLVLTVAIPVLLLVHVTDLLVALAGATVAVRVPVAPTLTLRLVGFRLTPVTATGFTVTFVVAVLPPSAVLPVMVAVPTALPVTTPLVLTVAIVVALLVQVIVLFVAQAGTIFIFTVTVFPTITDAVVAAAVNPVTGTFTLSAVTYPAVGALIFSHPPVTAV